MNKEKKKSQVWIWVSVAGGLLLLCVLLLRCFLPVLLEKAFLNKLHEAERTYGLRVRVDGMAFSDCSLRGTFMFSADSMRVQRNFQDSDIVRVIAPEVRMRAWKGLHKAVVLHAFRAEDIRVCWGTVADSAAQDGPRSGGGKKKISPGRLLDDFREHCPQKVEVVHLDCRYHDLTFLAENAGFRCHPAGRKGKIRNYRLQAGLREMQCAHPYLSGKPLRMDSIRLDWMLHLSSGTFEIDSVSRFQCHTLLLHPYLRVERGKTTHLVFRLDEPVDADSCFSALPEALFTVLPSLKAKGKIDCYCFLDVDFSLIDSLKFDFNLHSGRPSFRVVEGLENITRFNAPFEYTFCRNGEAVRTVSVGPENSFFCPFDRIPEALTASILASEDASFFRHRGFVKSSIQSALIDDIKAGRMRRGGSTISMQLVKNLYLNRQKVLTRKLEEMMLVWMIEDHALMSKERMFEIYVNIIEWGPDILGIGEAADFYFHKKPSELELNECVYLATLIRAPRHYASSLQPDGMVTEARQAELQFVADRMLDRGLITEAQHAVFSPQVQTVVVRQAEPVAQDRMIKQ